MSDRICDDCKKEMGQGENRKSCKTCGKRCCTQCIKRHNTPNATVKKRKR